MAQRREGPVSRDGSVLKPDCGWWHNCLLKAPNCALSDGEFYGVYVTPYWNGSNEEVPHSCQQRWAQLTTCSFCLHFLLLFSPTLQFNPQSPSHLCSPSDLTQACAFKYWYCWLPNFCIPSLALSPEFRALTQMPVQSHLLVCNGHL